MSHLQAPRTQPHRLSLREFSFPCPFICWYCFFYLLCLTYFTEGAGSNLSILKEAKKNYMGRFIFSMGRGSICLFLIFCGFPWVETSTAGRVYDLCVYYMTGAPEGSLIPMPKNAQLPQRLHLILWQLLFRLNKCDPSRKKVRVGWTTSFRENTS